MVFRTRYAKFGAHYHVRVFTAVRPGATWAKVGELTMTEADWAAFIVAFDAEHLEEVA